MNNLKTARKAAGLTQAEVAAQIGISQNAYSYWENGKVKIDNESLVKLARLFGKTTDYLMGITEPTRQAEISYAVFCLKKKKKAYKGTGAGVDGTIKISSPVELRGGT